MIQGDLFHIIIHSYRELSFRGEDDLGIEQESELKQSVPDPQRAELVLEMSLHAQFLS